MHNFSLFSVSERTVPFPSFRRILIHCVLNGATLLGALPEIENENIKYFIPLSENRTHNRPVYNRALVPLFHDNLTIFFIIKTPII